MNKFDDFFINEFINLKTKIKIHPQSLFTIIWIISWFTCIWIYPLQFFLTGLFSLILWILYSDILGMNI